MRTRVGKTGSPRHWPSLIALLAITMMSYWATVGFLSTPASIRSAPSHIPDLVIEKFAARKLDRAGDVQYSLSADSLMHYGDDGSAHATEIRFVSQVAGKPGLAVQAPRGELRTSSAAEDEVALSGGVKAQSSPVGKLPAIQLETPDMTLYPDKRVARANHGVTMLSTAGRARAERMVLDADLGKIHLTNADATFESARR